MGWFKDKVTTVANWVVEKSPPPFKRFAKNNPKTFWLIMAVLVPVPMGITVYLLLSGFVWLFYLW